MANASARLRLVPIGTDGAVDEDQALVERAQAGDQQAFATLFERHHGRVFAMCSRMLGDPVEVEDAVQHAFLEAWRCLPRFEGRARFSTWVTRIAIHTCFGFRRRLSRLLLSDSGDVDDRGKQLAFVEGPMAPDEGAAHRARRDAVNGILLSLSPKKRVVFVLAEFEGMTAPEIAEIVEVPEATVRTRLFHARKDFAKAAKKHPGFGDLFADGDGGGA